MQTAESVRYAPGPWRQVVAMRVLCSDNRERWARVGNPDSYFSCPARVSVGGRTVAGFVASGGQGEPCTFHASRLGKNAGKLPSMRQMPIGAPPGKHTVPGDRPLSTAARSTPTVATGSEPRQPKAGA